MVEHEVCRMGREGMSACRRKGVVDGGAGAEGWKNGRMEEWKDGKSGRMGRVEGWKSGRMGACRRIGVAAKREIRS
jgi:hypothetical protein